MIKDISDEALLLIPFVLSLILKIDGNGNIKEEHVPGLVCLLARLYSDYEEKLRENNKSHNLQIVKQQGDQLFDDNPGLQRMYERVTSKGLKSFSFHVIGVEKK